MKKKTRGKKSSRNFIRARSVEEARGSPQAVHRIAAAFRTVQPRPRPSPSLHPHPPRPSPAPCPPNT
ncbi:hypothetical protein ADJ79_11710 [Ottowia sp. oral taxon 894]|nr:hypothetical protein ADJ79_11710 [Ottowia sp. oral taxon 894]